MREDFEMFVKVAAITAVWIVVLAALFCGVIYVNVTFFDNVPVVCVVEGKEVYRGTSAGISVHSTGDTTTVEVSGGFLYLFPKAYYTSHDVKMTGRKDD